MAFSVVSLGTFMGTMDMSGLIVALPILGQRFDAPPETVLWLVLAFSLTFTSVMLTAGRAADVLGRKRVYAAGFLVFTLGLALCSTAQGLWQLVGYRVFQAVGGAMLVSNTNAIIADAFPDAERGKALGLMESVVGAGLMTGPVVSGILLDLWDWPAIFYVRIPLGVMGLVLAWRVLREANPAGPRPRFDPAGALTLSAGLLCLLAAINQGHRVGWSSLPILALLGGGFLLLMSFFLIEVRVSAPVIDLRLFRDRTFAAYNTLLLAYFIPSASLPFLLPFFLVQSAGYASFVAGLFLTVVPVLMFLMSPFTGILSDRLGSWAMATGGLAFLAAGFLLVSRLSTDFSVTLAIVGLGVAGIGAGLFLTPTYSAVMGATPPDHLGTASALIATLRGVGVSVGQAATATFLAIRREEHLQALPSGLDDLARARQSLALGFQDAVLLMSAVALLGVLIALFFARPTDRPPSPERELVTTARE